VSLPRLLALDLSSDVGVARLVRHQVPEFETVRLKGSIHQRLGEFADWMDKQTDFDGMAWEQPLIMPGDVVSTLELLYGLVGIAHVTAYRRKLPWREVPVPTAKLELTGNSRATKDEMLYAAVNAMDWVVSTHHEADAGACGIWAYEQLWPVPVDVRGPLL
jgi:Holliday junction resolvasome RuvABC endonuclease subunit